MTGLQYEAALTEARTRIEALYAPLGSRRAAASYNHGIDDALHALSALAQASQARGAPERRSSEQSASS